MRIAALLLAAGLLALAGLFGYGRWSEDVCITDGRAASLPEGSLGRQSTRWWPPGAVRCHWRTPSGERVAFTVTLWSGGS